MCGIAGFVQDSRSGEAWLRRMTDSIAHRGPDADGYRISPPAFLGHRRLSIIDLSAGAQPMHNEDRSVWIIYNGEIFNHTEIREELELHGHVYTTHCDTETILHAYEQWGVRSVERFRGMFAFAIWDEKAQRLVCVRDRLGIKPFYYFWDGKRFVFASEIKALFEHPAVSPRFEESTISDYLSFGFTSGDQTMFSGIRKLMPGHTLTLQWGDQPRIHIEQYWDPPRVTEFQKRSDQDWIRECRQRLEETVRMRLMSDVPLGMFLSGGVDSSAIAALIKRMVTGPVKTYAVGYAEAAYSELEYARQVARRIGTDHHEIVLTMEDFFNSLPRLVWHEDEPISWPSSVSLYFVAKRAAEDVKVVLTGEGSDELFGGYGRYRFYQMNHRLWQAWRHVPESLRNGMRQLLTTSPLLSAAVRRKLQHTVLGRDAGIRSLYLDNFYCAFSQEQQRKLLLRGASDPYSEFLSYWERASHSPFLHQMLYADQKTYLVELLMKQDQMSMACSIESRVPFLDHRFLEFAASVPEHMKIRNGEGKYILKKAVEDILPADIIYRKKMGFPTPIRSWFLRPEAAPIYDYLRDSAGLLSAYVDRSVLEDLIARYQSNTEDATDRIWQLLNLQVWGDMYITGRRERCFHGLLGSETTMEAPA